MEVEEFEAMECIECTGSHRIVHFEMIQTEEVNFDSTEKEEKDHD